MLTLTVLRCPPFVAPESRQVWGGEITIGRSQECDWTLPDPERQLSKRHCIVAYRAGGWQVADISSNGTFLNHTDTPVGPAAPRPLSHGDRLRVGAYEIEVTISTEQDRARVQPAPPPITDNPFEDEPLWPLDEPIFPDPVDQPVSKPPVSDHTASENDAFHPPRPVQPLLPTDWNLDLDLPSPRPPEPPPPGPTPGPTLTLPLVHADATGDLMAAFLRGAGMPSARPADPVAAMESLGQAFRAFVVGLRGTMIARAAVKGEFRIEQTMVRTRGNNPLKFSAGDDDALAALLGVGRHVDMTPAQAVTEALHDMRLHELATVAAMRSAVRSLFARLDPATLRRAAEAAGGFAQLSTQRKARSWDVYEALYASTAAALQDEFDAVFGRAFASAYELALQDAARKRDQA